MTGMRHTVAETPAFARDAAAAGMTEAEKGDLITFLAAHPEAGDLIVGTGAARKVRWRRPGTGRSCGYRVITYCAGRALPVFLLAVCTKGEGSFPRTPIRLSCCWAGSPGAAGTPAARGGGRIERHGFGPPAAIGNARLQSAAMVA
jgi:hypothetical protein